MSQSENTALLSLFGAHYYQTHHPHIVTAQSDDLYYYTTYIGQHTIHIEVGDCVYWLSDDQSTAYLQKGAHTLQSKHIATCIRGYMPDNKSASVTGRTTLPYVNGCSSKQIFPPERPGDPTLQLLNIPPFSSEQVHHIHSTVRIAYILSGYGKSVIGIQEKVVTEDLFPGKVIILEKMCPHHFETHDQPLRVLPLHIYSTVGHQEKNHPMFNGTQLIE